MRKKYIFATVFIVLAICEGFCSDVRGDFGLTNKVHLTITLSTNVVSPNSTVQVHCKMENSWTNAVWIYDSGRAETDSQEFLFDSTGKELDITPDDPNAKARKMFRNRVGSLDVGKTFEWDVVVGISEKTKPGEYRVKIRRGVMVKTGNGDSRIIEKIGSNTPEVHVR